MRPTLPVARTVDGRYRRERLLGKGGMGSVYEASDLLLRRSVAFKVLVGDIFGPYSSLVPELRDYTLPISAVEYHPDYMTEQHYQTYRSLGIQLVSAFITTTEALGAIQRWEPEYVITNEAMLVRRWIAN